MRKLLKSMKTLLVAAGLCAGTNSVWGEDNYVQLFTQDFENAETYSANWSEPSGFTSTTNSQASRTKNETSVHFFQALRNGKGPRGTQYTFPDIFKKGIDYKFEFYWANGNTYGDYSTNYLKIFDVSNEAIAYMTVTANNDNNPTYFYKYDNGVTSEIGNFKMQSRGMPSTFYHIIIEGISGEGIYMTVKTEDDATTKIARTLLTTNFASLGRMEISVARSNYDAGQGFDDFSLSLDMTTLLSRAETASTNASALLSAIMNSNVKNELSSAISSTASYVAFTKNDINESNFDSYLSAIETLETAVTNAQASVDDFTILNELIANANTFATTVTEYNAPSGAESVYAEDADVDPATLATSVRNEIARAGAEHGNNTDISAIIVNKGFEMGSILGWNINGAPATAKTDIDSNGGLITTGDGNLISGTYTYYTGWNGRNINQTISWLPAGNYKLTAKAKSWTNGEWRCTVALVANSGASEPVSMEGGAQDLEYEFTVLGSETSINIGIAGTNGASSPYPTGGSWGYYCDDFTLTYVGQDPVAQAKASLEAEIETATALKNSWTAKVGTAPFKYDATYYDALATEIDEAQAVVDADGDDADAYTTAKSELETAETNMASSTQNAPDPDKFYRLYVANNDGTASDYNLNMLKRTTKTQVTVSAAPYPVKFVVSTGYAGRYRIQTVYGGGLCTDKNAITTAYVSGAEGVETRLEDIAITSQSNGTIKLSSTRSSNSYYYAASASEGAGVTATTGNTGTWVVSDPIDVTDVTLSVNATAGWGTFIAPYDNLTPSTVKAYTVSYKNGNTVFFEENETGVLSANTPYILSTEESENVSTTFKGIANNSEDSYEVNGLVGLLTAGSVPAGSYVLQYQANVDGTAFYKTANGMNGTANRCYLDLAKVSEQATAGARSTVSFMVFGDDVTGINGVNASETVENAQKGIYNLNGQRVSNPTKGLYIVNGKKVIVK